MNNGKPYYYCCKYCGFVSASSSVFVDHKKMVHGKEQTRMSAPKKRSVEAHDDGRAGTASALHPSSNHQLQSDDDVMFLKEVKKSKSSDMDQHGSDDLSDFMEDDRAGSNLGEEVIHLGGDNEDESQKLVRSIRENSSMDRQTLGNSQPTIPIADFDQEYLFRTIPDFAATFPSIQEDAGPPSPNVQNILDQNENEENQNEIEIQHDLENIEVEPELPQWDDNPIPQDEQIPDNGQNADAESRSPSVDPLIQCPFCSEVFGSIQEVTAHYFTHGIIQRPGSRPRQVQSKYVCAVCTDAFTTNKNYERHIAQAHPGYVLWRCEYCPYGAVSQQQIVTHNVIHTRQGEFECGFCNASFNTKSARGRHKKVHDDQVIGQGQCNIYVVEHEVGQMVTVSEEPPFDRSYAAEPIRVRERSAPPEFTQSAPPLNETSSSTTENVESDTHFGNNNMDLAEPCTFCDRRFPSMMDMESHLREDCGGAPVGINEELTSTIASQPTIEPPRAPPTIDPPTDGVESMELDPPVGPTNNDIEEVEEDEVQILPQVQMAPLPLFTLPTKNYQCPYCNFKDPFPAKLQRHVKYSHPEYYHIFLRMSEDASKLSAFLMHL